MARGISPIVAVVLLIAIAIIAAAGLYFWTAGIATKQPVPNVPVTINAIPLGSGKILIANLGSNPINSSELKATSGNISCPSIPAGEQALCNLTDLGTAGDVVIYGSSTGSVVVQGSTIGEEEGGSDGGGCSGVACVPTVIQLVSDPVFQFGAHIYGDRIVWVDRRDNPDFEDIFMCDIAGNTTDLPTWCNALQPAGGLKKLTTVVARRDRPIIYGNRVIWDDWRNDHGGWTNADLYMYDLATDTEVHLTTSGAIEQEPAIYGDRIAWRDNRNGNENIYMCDLTGAPAPLGNWCDTLQPAGGLKQITTNPANEYAPVVYGDLVAWADSRDGGPQLYLYDLSAGVEIPVVTSSGSHSVGGIEGTKIAFSDFRNPEFSIRVCDIAGNTTPLSTWCETPQPEGGLKILASESAPNYLQNANMRGDKVVWGRGTETLYEIHLYDLPTCTETLIATGTLYRDVPFVYGNKIVWDEYRDDTGYDIPLAVCS